MRGMARDPRDRAEINRALMSHGLGTLEEAGLVSQIGFLVKDHEHFRQLVNSCVPEHRVEMYNAIKPYVRFELRPLDVYIAESAELAERKQLPTVAPDGTLKEYQASEVKTEKTGELLVAQKCVAAAAAKGWLTLVCKQCTFEAEFPGMSRLDAIHQARMEGWKYAGEAEYCPACSALRN